LRGLVGVELFDIAEEKDFAVTLRKACDAIANLCPHFGLLQTCGSGLDSSGARESAASTFATTARKVIEGDDSASVPRPPDRDTSVDQDPVQPGPKLGVSLERANGPISREQGILDGVSPVLGVLQVAAGHGEHPLVVLADKAFKRLRIAGTQAGQQSGFRGHRESLHFWS
jgi:hypothetical protein